MNKKYEIEKGSDVGRWNWDENKST